MTEPAVKDDSTSQKTPYMIDLSDTQAMYFVYGCAAGGVPIGMLLVPDWALSSILTYSVHLTVCACAMVALYITKSRDMRGISLKAFKLQLFGALMRLACTTWLNGYIPSDSSGDGLYQVLDGFVAVFCIYIIAMAMGTLRWTYYEEYDTFPFNAAVWFCFIFASLTHPNLNGRPLFDTLWNVSLYMDSMSAAPQIVMMMKNHIASPSCICHFVFFYFLNRVFSLIFWIHGYVELTYSTFSYAGEVCLLAHVLSLLFSMDFARYYLKAMRVFMTSGQLDSFISNLMV